MRRDATETLIQAQTYPTTSDEVAASHGDHELRLADGTERLGDVLARLGEETYETPADLRNALRCGVSHEAVGRRYYSDRDAYTVAEDGIDQVSF
jgi:hypothetical protein